PRARPALHSSPTRRSSDLELTAGEPVRAPAVEALGGRSGQAGHVALDLESDLRLHVREVTVADGKGFQLIGVEGESGGWVERVEDRKSTRLNSSHSQISYA